MSIAFKYRANPPVVILTRDSTGEETTIDMADFKANEQAYVDQYCDPPVAPEPTTEEKLADALTQLADLKKRGDAREAVLIDKGLITKKEVDDAAVVAVAEVLVP